MRGSIKKKSGATWCGLAAEEDVGKGLVVDWLVVKVNNGKMKEFAKDGGVLKKSFYCVVKTAHSTGKQCC